MGKPRQELPEGGLYHVFARGNDRCDVFRDVADRVRYLEGLRDVVERGLARCLAYCLMSNHIHLVLETQRATLGRAMQLLHSRYARDFNRRHGRAGHLFQGVFGSTTIADDAHACMALRYVALNPVMAGLCDRPEAWQWSSCSATMAPDPPPWLDVTRVLELLDWLGGDHVDRYRELVSPA